jgi:glyoxylase-like metal-dependent hydrolase (beta-lactamase superfamily II)
MFGLTAWRSIQAIAMSIAVSIAVATASLAQDASDVLKRASDAMGATGLKSLKYSDAGIGYTYGQAFRPGMAWPKINIHSHVRTINYESGSMRDEITLSRAEPTGGGGYPAVAQQKNDEYVSGTYAWNVTAAGTVPNPRLVTARLHQMWITPHGAVKAAIRNVGTLKKPAKGGAKAPIAVTFTESGRFAATVYFNADNLVERVESSIPDPVVGETTAVTLYSDYRDFGGIKFPASIRQIAGGFPVLEVTVSDVAPNAPAEIQIPDAVRVASEKVVADKVADGVWFLGGGSHNSVVIEMKDHVILVEAPLSDGRMLPILEQLRQLVPAKPLRYVINSHTHFDHSGGLRAAAAEGATIVTQEANQPYYAKAFATSNKIAPDHLAKTGAKPRFQPVKEKAVLSDGSRSVEIHRIKESVHSDAFVLAYLPAEKLLIEADAYTPLPPNAPPPSPPNPNHLNLIENIERLKLAVERILPLHGRVVPVADLYAAAGRPAPK